MQGEVLEELQHHYPLDLLMTLSDAAVGAMQARGSNQDHVMMLSAGLMLRAVLEDVPSLAVSCTCASWFHLFECSLHDVA